MYEKRLSKLFFLFALLFGVILVQCFRVQVTESARHLAALESRRKSRTSILPRRGEILFADGTKMASNEPGYGVHVNLAEFDAGRFACAECGAESAVRAPVPGAPERCPSCGETERFRLHVGAHDVCDDTTLLARVEPWDCLTCGAVVEEPVPAPAAPASCPRCGAQHALRATARADASELSRLLDTAPDDVKRAFERVRSQRRARRARRLMRYETFVLLPRVSREVGEAVALAAHRSPGLVAMPVADRHVVPFVRNIVGRAGQPTPGRLAEMTDSMRVERGLYRYTEAEVYRTLFGTSGLERSFDEQLRGVPGRMERVRAERKGESATTRVDVDVQDGMTLRTTLQPTVQALAEDIVQSCDMAGAAVVLDVRTGAVVAIASKSTNGYHQAVSIVQPGSVFKLVTALAHLATGGTTSQTENCTQRGRVHPRGMRYHCEGWHNDIALEAAFAKSCNAYFMKRAEAVGVEAMTDACKRLGLEHSWQLGLRGSPAGLELSGGPDQPWTWHELANVGYGQGKATATPLQIAVAYARIANGGMLVEPYLIESAGDQITHAAPERDPVLARHARELRKAARMVVTEGTADDVAELAAVNAAGKSGTAEIVRRKGDPEVVVTPGRTAYVNNAWFVGYAPYDAPRYVAVVVNERVLGHGAAVSGAPTGRLLAAALALDVQPPRAPADGERR